MSTGVTPSSEKMPFPSLQLNCTVLLLSRSTTFSDSATSANEPLIRSIVNYPCVRGTMVVLVSATAVDDTPEAKQFVSDKQRL
jgi:hypothetical protein